MDAPLQESIQRVVAGRRRSLLSVLTLHRVAIGVAVVGVALALAASTLIRGGA